MTPEERLSIRKLNEQTKLTATAVNAAAIALLGGAVIIPGINNPAALLTWQALALFLGSVALHVVARTVLLLLRSEE
ncbi:MAG: hypothetical protein ACRYGP_06005 [Janthinobacterium lividum]